MSSTILSNSFGVDFFDESDTPANSKLIETGHTPVTFRTRFRDTLPQGAEEQSFINPIALIPRGHLVYLTPVSQGPTHHDEPRTRIPYAIGSFRHVPPTRPALPHETSPIPPTPIYDVFRPTKWRPDPLLTSLAHLTLGGQAISLGLCVYPPPIPPDVMGRLRV